MISQEFLPKSSLSSKGPQASEEDVPGGTDGLGHYRKDKCYSSEDAECSRGMHT